MAAIDVGTNSFHLVVASVDDGGRFEVLTREREPLRLGRAPSRVADPATVITLANRETVSFDNRDLLAAINSDSPEAQSVARARLHCFS